MSKFAIGTEAMAVLHNSYSAQQPNGWTDQNIEALIDYSFQQAYQQAENGYLLSKDYTANLICLCAPGISGEAVYVQLERNKQEDSTITYAIHKAYCSTTPDFPENLLDQYSDRETILDMSVMKDKNWKPQPMSDLQFADIKKEVVEIVRSRQLSSRADKINLADIAGLLAVKGINYKELGFEKLKQFIDIFPDVLETSYDDSGKTAYVRCKLDMASSSNQSSMSSQNDVENVANLLAEMFQNNSDEEGILLAKVGAYLLNYGVQYKSFGYPKLKNFLEAFGFLEVYDDTSFFPPVSYVRCKNGIEKSSAATFRVPEITVNKSKSSDAIVGKEPNPDILLYRWAFIPDYKIEELANKLYQGRIKEKWYYGSKEPSDVKNKYAILIQYLTYTFKRLCHEKKVVVTTDSNTQKSYAAFHTGLVDKMHQDIFAVFEENQNPNQQPWFLKGFTTFAENASKWILHPYFHANKPQLADYFEGKWENLFFDPALRIECIYEHILRDRCLRFPEGFYTKWCGKEFTQIDGMSFTTATKLPATDPRKKEYTEKLKAKITASNQEQANLVRAFQNAVDYAKNRARRNYKIAIPMYFPSQNKMSLLLPLALIDNDHVNLALVLERKQEQTNSEASAAYYMANTVLPLDWAYADSRLIARPDNEWLVTDALDDSDLGTNDSIVDHTEDFISM